MSTKAKPYVFEGRVITNASYFMDQMKSEIGVIRDVQFRYCTDCGNATWLSSCPALDITKPLVTFYDYVEGTFNEQFCPSCDYVRSRHPELMEWVLRAIDTNSFDGASNSKEKPVITVLHNRIPEDPGEEEESA